METIARPPTMPPAIAPPFELLPFGDAVEDEATDVGGALTPDVYTPVGPKIAPGPYSGVSIWNVGV